MKAVVVERFGGPEQLRLAQVPDPVARPGQVRISVRAAGVDPVDASNRADGSWAGLRAPSILGYDVAGVIESTGLGVTGLTPGDRVMAMTHFPDGAGGYAELAVVDARLAAPIGARISFADAAATPLGLFLVQLAAAAGIVTIGLGRRAMHDQMLGLGAASCIDYTSEDVAQRAGALAGGRVDAIADLVGGSLAQTALTALKPGGQIAAIATPVLDLDWLLDANITFHGVLIQDDGDRTRALASLLADGVVRRVVSHVLPLAAAARAHQIVESGHAGGKIVLEVAGASGASG